MWNEVFVPVTLLKLKVAWPCAVVQNSNHLKMELSKECRAKILGIGFSQFHLQPSTRRSKTMMTGYWAVPEDVWRGVLEENLLPNGFMSEATQLVAASFQLTDDGA